MCIKILAENILNGPFFGNHIPPAVFIAGDALLLYPAHDGCLAAEFEHCAELTYGQQVGIIFEQLAAAFQILLSRFHSTTGSFSVFCQSRRWACLSIPPKNPSNFLFCVPFWCFRRMRPFNDDWTKSQKIKR